MGCKTTKHSFPIRYPSHINNYLKINYLYMLILMVHQPEIMIRKYMRNKFSKNTLPLITILQNLHLPLPRLQER